MTKKCGCRPGTFESGWHEVRCQECLDAEARMWAGLVTRWHTHPYTTERIARMKARIESRKKP